MGAEHVVCEDLAYADYAIETGNPNEPVKRMDVGARVKRGPNWKYPTDEGGKLGVLVGPSAMAGGYAEVRVVCMHGVR